VAHRICRQLLVTSIAANGATAFLVIVAMTSGLILPRMLLETVRDMAQNRS
jgi:hypothetical protein